VRGGSKGRNRGSHVVVTLDGYEAARDLVEQM
jgi:hypothetical protein